MTCAEEAMLYINKAVQIVENWSYDESDDYVTDILKVAEKLRKFAEGLPIPTRVASSNPHITDQETDI